MGDVIYFPGLVPTTFPAVETFLRENVFARRRLEIADEVLGYSLVEAYERAEVYDWEVYEAGFLALTLALADWAHHHVGLYPVTYGGQSFGAVIGAVFGGVLDYRDAVVLVRESTRVEVEYFDALDEPLGCFFFYRLDAAAVDRIVQRSRDAGHAVEASIYLDNSVHAVSGTVSGLDHVRSLVQEAGGFPFYLMNRAEHCSMVGGLRERLEHEVYSKLEWRPGRYPMLSDVSGRMLTDPVEIMHDLLDGWTTPVRWTTVVDGIRASGAERAVVVGPRNMFGRLTRSSLPTITVTPRSVADHDGSSTGPRRDGDDR